MDSLSCQMTLRVTIIIGDNNTMKVKYNLNKLSVEFEADTVKEVWHQLAVFQEVFGEESCVWNVKPPIC